MRHHPSLLAIGLLLFVALACKMGNTNNSNNANNANNANSTSNANTNATPKANTNPAGVHIDNLYMAKSSDGKATTTFSPTDHTVYCVAELNKLAKGTQMKFSWIAVDVEGEEKGSKIKDVDYTTGSLENIVKAHLSLPQDWPKGQYKVEVYINGDLGQSINYTVE
ncbi:MAG: hypothetical protein DMF64_16850 [Acidobacteria bacterium]|nr:MAG: hypothetical protein DMF64_16850 [Acidobacteriota bacterium]